MTKKTIKIAGAGISGLTAAINLAIYGYDVKVYEKRKDVGARFHNDFQGLENWSSDEDILSTLRKINIKVNFFYKGFNEADIINERMEKFKIKSPDDRTGVYMIKRGREEGSIDQCLKNQALHEGVEILFNKNVKDEDVDIIAKGPRFGSGIVCGLIGNVKSKDKVMIMLNNNCAPKGYVYMAIIDGRITLASVVMKDFNNAKHFFKNALENVTRIYDYKINNIKLFGGLGNFFLPNSYSENGRLYIGESAGLQDYLFGFGMKYAFLSGYFAAQSIISNHDYNVVVKKELLPIMKATFVNRHFYERLSNYERLIQKWATAKNPILFLRNWYNFNWYKHLIFPFIFK